MKPLSLMTLFIIFCLTGCGSTSAPLYSNSSAVAYNNDPQCIEGDCINGYGVLQYPNKGKYEGNFVNSLFDGFGKYFFANGDYFFGNFTQGYRQGKGVLFTTNGNLYKGLWDRGDLNGSCIYKVDKDAPWEEGTCLINSNTVSFQKNPVTKPTNAELKKKADSILERIKKRKY